MSESEKKNGQEPAPPIDAEVNLQVSPDRMEAWMVLTPPQNGGKTPSSAELCAFLAQRNIVFGVRQDNLDALARFAVYNQSILVAEGRPGEPGVDAEIRYHIRLEKNLAPKVRADGTVDFKNLDILEPVSKGAVLCEKRPSTAGTPGMTVYGETIPVKAGRDLNLPAGKNAALSEDKLRLVSLIDGHADIAGKKINVLDTFTVEGDVSHATGNITFAGNVVVTGAVLAGFSVRAAGNVDIHGAVDGADVSAGGLLAVRGGFSGGRTGSLSSGSHTTCRFIQGGRVTTGGNLDSTYILNAVVHCGGAVNLSGKGLIVGGRVTARFSVEANVLGNVNTSVPTIVEAGNDVASVRRSNEIPKELAACEKNLRALEVSLHTLLQLKQAGRINEDQTERLDKTALFYQQLKDKQAELLEEYEAARQEIAKAGHGVVKVRQTAYPGVKIIIGTEQLLLTSEYAFTAFTRTDEGISAGPLR